MGYPVVPTFLSEVPGVIKATGLLDVGDLIRYKDKEVEKQVRVVDNDFFSMFSFPTIAGAAVNPLASTANVVLSKSTADALFGKENPIGKVVKVKVNNDWNDLVVTAVLQDAGENSSIQYDALARIELSSDYAKYKNSWNSQNHNVFIQLAPGMSPAVVEKELRGIRKKYLVVDEKDMKSRGYLTENTRRWYESEQRLSSIFFSAAAIAILLSCLGLFAIVTLVLEQRRKEIGVRKVLGASMMGITGLLSREFLKLIVLAFVIAVPIGVYFLDQWLRNFIYRTSLSWWIFAVAGLVSVAIALLTIGVQTVRAALANPVESLRSE